MVKTIDRLAAVDASMPKWQAIFPALQSKDVLLLRLIRAASQGITSCFDPPLARYGLTESSYHALVVVTAHGRAGTTPSALCGEVGHTRANMTRILGLLESQGLVSVSSDSRDGRRKWIRVSPTGRDLVRTCAAELEPIIAAALGNIPTADKTEVERVLREVVTALGTVERRRQSNPAPG